MSHSRLFALQQTKPSRDHCVTYVGVQQNLLWDFEPSALWTIPAKQIDGISNDGVLLIHGDTPSALNSAWVGGCRRLPLETAARGRFRSSDQG